MKRTAEKIFGILGIILSFLFLLGGMGKVLLQNSANLQAELRKSLESGNTLSSNEIDSFINSLTNGGLLISIVSLVGLILGFIALSNLKNNKNEKKAGILFIAAALFIGVLTLGAGILPVIFYLIAGVMTLIRKPKFKLNEASRI